MNPLLKTNPGSVPWMKGVQRRYASQRSVPTVDAEIEFDIRTAFDGTKPIKQQRQWLDIAYDVFTNKNSNFQMQIGIKFPFRACPMIHTERALDVIAGAWIACTPIVRLAWATEKAPNSMSCLRSPTPSRTGWSNF
jgi:hypothetical protein